MKKEIPLVMKKILLIDDDEIFNFLNKSIIENSGFEGEIGSCSSGKRALAFLADCLQEKIEMPDIIFLDIQMPAMDGFEFLEEFFKLPENSISNVKIAMLTSSLNESDKKRSFEYKNVIDFINKPLCETKIIELESKLG